MDLKLSVVLSQWRKSKEYSRVLSILPDFDFEAVYHQEELSKIINEFYLAFYYTQQYTEAAEILQKYQRVQVTPGIIKNSDFLLKHLRQGKNIIATCDPSRKPTEHEIVIIYGDYPCTHLSLAGANPMFRNIKYHDRISHDSWEFDPCFRDLKAIYLVTSSENSYIQGIRELAKIQAPLDRIQRIEMGWIEEDLERYHKTFQALKGCSGISMVLYEGFNFPPCSKPLHGDTDASSNSTSDVVGWAPEYFNNLMKQDFSFCPISYQMSGHIEVLNEFTAVPKTYLSNIRGFLFNSLSLEVLKGWAQNQIHKINQGQSFKYITRHYWDWLIQQNIKISRKQLCFVP